MSVLSCKEAKCWPSGIGYNILGFLFECAKERVPRADKRYTIYMRLILFGSIIIKECENIHAQ